MGVNKTTTQETALTSVAASDVVRIVDISDTTDSPDGSNKKCTVQNFVKAVASNDTPEALTSSGTAGTDETYSRSDHAHPTTGLRTQGAESIYVPVTAMKPRITNGCADIASLEISTTTSNIYYMAFDKDTIEYAQFSVAMPKSWNQGTFKVRFYWLHPSTTTNFDVVWGAQCVAIRNDDALSTAYGSAQTVTSRGGTTNDLYTQTTDTGDYFTAEITPGGTVGQNNWVDFQVSRQATNGADTLAVDAYLVGVLILYTTNAVNDS